MMVLTLALSFSKPTAEHQHQSRLSLLGWNKLLYLGLHNQGLIAACVPDMVLHTL